MNKFRLLIEVGMFVALGIAVAMLVASNDREAQLSAEIDAMNLEAAGATVGEVVTASTLEDAFTERVREQIMNIQRAVPSARPVAAILATTGPIDTRVQSDHERYTKPADQYNARTGPVKVTPGDAYDDNSPIDDDCLLRYGQTAELTCEVAEVRADSGAAAVTGAASLLVDGQVALYAPFDAKASRYLVAPSAPARSPRWLAGPVVGWSRAGWQYGAAVATPPVRVRRVEARAFGAVMGGGGDGSVMVGVLVGW